MVGGREVMSSGIERGLQTNRNPRNRDRPLLLLLQTPIFHFFLPLEDISVYVPLRVIPLPSKLENSLLVCPGLDSATSQRAKM